MDSNTIELLYGGMRKLGPGDNSYTLAILRSLPHKEIERVVDAGCGAGRQTLVLAKELRCVVHAVDTHEPFLNTLNELAREEGVSEFVETHCMDMASIPNQFESIDLLWSEGAAYNIGFANALSRWATAMKENGLVVVSELAWLSDDAPKRAREFFEKEYPDMKLNEENVRIAEASGYRVLDIIVLPEASWNEGYYDVLKPRAEALLDHPDQAVSAFAQESLEEIEVFQNSEGSYGYVFYVLQLS